MGPVSVAVCACTYKRPEGLRALLRGLGDQSFATLEKEGWSVPKVSIIIADNEGSEAARAICAEFQRLPGAIPVTYVHEPQRGISFARNACLDHLPPDCDFFAFIDDDEVPAADWLEQLLRAQAATGAEIVQGPVVPVHSSSVPDWMLEPGFFGVPSGSFNIKRGALQNLDEIEWAATGNVLVRTAVVLENALRFDPDFAASGGEDKLFFLTLLRKGCKIVYAKEAVVYEEVHQARSNLRNMVARRFFYGNADARIDKKLMSPSGNSTFNLISVGAGEVAMGFRRLFRTIVGSKRTKDRFALGAFQIAYGVGVIAGALGYRYRHYK